MSIAAMTHEEIDSSRSISEYGSSESSTVMSWLNLDLVRTSKNGQPAIISPVCGDTSIC